MHESLVPTFRNAKHAAQWIATLRAYAFPSIGDRRVDEITTPDLHRLLTPIWTSKPETARRLLQRMSKVFDWAKAAGHRSGDNPSDGVKSGLANQSKTKQHHSAMPFRDVPNFVKGLRADPENALTQLPLEFLILTATLLKTDTDFVTKRFPDFW